MTLPTPPELPNEREVAICQSKVKHKTKAEAKDAASRTQRKFGIRLYTYECRVCSGFHLTKREPTRYRMAERRQRDMQDAYFSLPDTFGELLLALFREDTRAA